MNDTKKEKIDKKLDNNKLIAKGKIQSSDKKRENAYQTISRSLKSIDDTTPHYYLGYN